MSSGSISMISLPLLSVITPASYIGTVPIGISTAFIMFRLNSTRLFPVLKSIKVSAPYSLHSFALSTSSDISSILLLEPIFALTLVFNPSPTPQGFVSLRTFFSITTFPVATRFNNLLILIFSVLLIFSISGVILPFLASSNWVTFLNPSCLLYDKKIIIFYYFVIVFLYYN